MKDQNITWDDWQRKDQLILIICLFSMVVSVGMGMSFLVSNLRMSDPIFIQYPLLAIMVSTIVPIISLAIKFVSNFFTYGHNRIRYGKFIAFLTCFSAAIWIYLYGQVYPGVSLDYENFGEDHGLGSAMVWAQLSTEILATSTLGLMAESIYMRYYPDSFIQNPEYIEIERALKDQLAEHEKLGKGLGEVCGQITELEASREAYINEKIIEYICLYARSEAERNSFKNT